MPEVTLNNIFDKNGLVYCSKLSEASGRFYCSGEEVFIAPECRAIAEYLVKDRVLWSEARLRLNRVNTWLKRAPIIGVPFFNALEKALSSHGVLQKSLFWVPSWTHCKGKAVVATLLAHSQVTSSCIEFQAWQFLDVSEETFYVHARIDKTLSFVEHLDGATQIHSFEERDHIFARGVRIDGQQYKKFFRLDGCLSIAIVEDILNLYFPVQSLTDEFLCATREG